MARRKAGPDPVFIEWPAGRVFFRIHSVRYKGAQFRSEESGDARFSPIYARTRKPIPTLYGGETTVYALMATVFHEVPAPPGDYILDLGDLQGLAHSVLRPNRPLKLVDLTKKGLQRLGLKKTDLIETGPEVYAFTRHWAEQLHVATDAEGLCWMSRQDDEAHALLLFGDRVKARSLTTVAPSEALVEPRLRDLIVDIAERIGSQKIIGP